MGHPATTLSSLPLVLPRLRLPSPTLSTSLHRLPSSTAPSSQFLFIANSNAPQTTVLLCFLRGKKDHQHGHQEQAENKNHISRHASRHQQVVLKVVKHQETRSGRRKEEPVEAIKTKVSGIEKVSARAGSRSCRLACGQSFRQT